MKILDRKENVISIELTQYGKHLLTKGEFEPYGYSFFDDDVLYDSEFGGFSETQNSASVRIKETPKLSVQSSYAGIETEIRKIHSVIKQNQITDQGIAKYLANHEIQFASDKHYSALYPLGTMKIDADTKPAWNIQVYQGEIENVNLFKEDDGHPSVRIPQIDFKDVEFIVEIDKTNDDGFLPDGGSLSDLELLNESFEDGSFVKITEDGIFLEITEENVPFSNENFDVEVFEILTTNGKEVLVPLLFQQRRPQVVNGILLDNEEQDLSMPPLDPSCAEFFFEVRTDREIDPETICKLNLKEHPDEFMMSQIVICKELKKQRRDRNLYNTDVLLEDVEEPC